MQIANTPEPDNNHLLIGLLAILNQSFPDTCYATDEYGATLDFSDDPYLPDIIAHGQMIIPDEGDVCDNPPGHCHQSVSYILSHERQPDDVLYTGFALNDSGEWIVHSYICNNGRIVEPGPFLFVAYFGIPLTGEAEAAFINTWYRGAGGE